MMTPKQIGTVLGKRIVRIEQQIRQIRESGAVATCFDRIVLDDGTVLFVTVVETEFDGYETEISMTKAKKK